MTQDSIYAGGGQPWLTNKEALDFEGINQQGAAQFRSLMERAGSQEHADIDDDELLDLMRVVNLRTDPAHLAEYLKQLCPELYLEQDTLISQGDVIGKAIMMDSFIPLLAHLGQTDPFDRSDSALEAVFEIATTAMEQSKASQALILAVSPVFKFTYDAAGTPQKVIVQAGWLYDGHGWQDVIFSPHGVDDFLLQKRHYKGSDISRGLFRERGLSGQGTLDAILDILRSNASNAVGAQAPTMPHARNDMILATGSGDWSSFLSKKMLEAMKSLISAA